MEKKFLEPDEITRLKEIQSKFISIRDQLGEIEIQIIGLNVTKEDLKNELINLKKEELSLAQELQTRYGEGNISLNTGEFLQIK